MKEYKCKCCGKTKECSRTPYQWASIHEEAAGVHDSACVTWKDDYFLCDDCRWEAMSNEIDELKNK